MSRSAFVFLSCILASTIASSQPVDLIIRNGHVIDAKNNIDAIMDVAIKDGKISEVAAKITTEAKTVIDATGLYVIPGIIDIHGHHFHGTQPNAYLSNSFSALPPDAFTLRSGVTAVADAGGAGWRNFEEFKAQTIERSKTKVFAFINIVGSGMRGGAFEQDIKDMDPEAAAKVAKQYPQYIVGVKLAHYMSSDWEPTDRAVKAGALAGIPVMVDFGGADPPLSMRTLLT